MVVALLQWSFGVFVRRLHVCLLQLTLLQQALPDSDDGGAMTMAHLRLPLVFVVIARWSKDLFIFLLLLELFERTRMSPRGGGGE
jgi:hypothetical protein